MYMYIVGSDNEIKSKPNYLPSAKDLMSRGEKIVYSLNDYDIALCEFVDNQIVLKPVITKKIFDTLAFDIWLDNAFGGSALEALFPLIARATDRNTMEGYALLFKKANDNSVPEVTQQLIEDKLRELGANI